MPSITATDHAPAADPAEAASMTNREFVALVRARLDEAGHRDIAIERSWIDTDTPGDPFLLNVPVGPEFVVPLRAVEGFVRVSDPLVVARHVEHFAAALVTLRRAERTLVKYASEVRRAAAKAIAEARSEGLDILLSNVAFAPTYAWLLTGSDWKHAASHVLAEVCVRHTSFCLRPEISSVVVEEAGDVAYGLESILDDERELQGRLAYLDGLGADLIVDAITLDLLRTHVVDVEHALRDVWSKQHVSIPIKVQGFETQLSLSSNNGSVESAMILPEAVWNGEMLWLKGDAVETGLDRVGKTLEGLVSHPALACRKVVHIEQRPAEIGIPDRYYLDLSERFLFDADTGRIWPFPTTLEAKPKS